MLVRTAPTMVHTAPTLNTGAYSTSIVGFAALTFKSSPGLGPGTNTECWCCSTNIQVQRTNIECSCSSTNLQVQPGYRPGPS